MAMQDFSELFQVWLLEYFEKSKTQKNFVDLLFKSQEYSLRSGGKRFRPYLASIVFQIWNSDLSLMKNFCLAIEMIHTYSLIHDDLPCMDNDDYRRGQPTNHKIFQEDVALLTGDALLTEAFHLISSEKKLSAETRIQLIEFLSRKIGSFGMVGGQVLDMRSTQSICFEQLQQIHQMKTACLIEAAAFGGAVIAGVQTKELEIISKFSEHLGMAFQIKDDLLDIKDNEQDFKNYVSVLGFNETVMQLETHSQMALEKLAQIQNSTLYFQKLQDLVNENLKRNF